MRIVALVAPLAACGASARIDLSIQGEANTVASVRSLEIVAYRGVTRSGTILACNDPARSNWRSSEDVSLVADPQVAGTVNGSLTFTARGEAVVIEVLAYDALEGLGKVVASGCARLETVEPSSKVSAVIALEPTP